MSTEMSMILLWLVLLQEGAAIRPVVNFLPNYNRIFRSSMITMICDGGSTSGLRQNYTWYKDSKEVYNRTIFTTYTIPYAETSHSGYYQCQTRAGEISDPARLEVIHGWVILQTPLYVYEGDDLTLRCHHFRGYQGRQTRFYKDNKAIRGQETNDDLYTISVDRSTSGTYKCTKEVEYNSIYYQHVDEVSVSVQELFPTPRTKVAITPFFEKNTMTLTCETSLPPPPRHNTQLQIAFYREGGIVQGFGVNDTYVVYNVQLEDSGKYSCEVETTDGRVRKRSAEQIIQIDGLFSQPKMIMTNNMVVEGDLITLTCDMTLGPTIKPTDVQFAFYRNGQKVQGFTSSNKYEAQSAQMENSGNYTCEIKNVIDTVVKRSHGYYIRIEELFSIPTISMTPNSVSMGDNMTLTCQTRLHPSRQNTQLWFTFYREGGIVQGFGVSDNYKIYSLQMEDCGKYSCQVSTSERGAMKRSAEQVIQLDGNIGYTRQNIIRLTLSTCVLIAAALFVFHHIQWMKSTMSTHVPTAGAIQTNLHLEPMTDNCVNYVNITDNTMQM